MEEGRVVFAVSTLITTCCFTFSGGHDRFGERKVEMSTEIRITIYVRGRPHDILDDKIGYERVVNLGYPHGKRGPLYEYDVTWKDGPKAMREGTLKDGETTPIVKDMRFDVHFTDKS